MTTETLAPGRLPVLPSPRTLGHGALARLLVHRMVERMPVRVRYPNGSDVGGGSCGCPIVDLVDPDAFYRRLEAHPKIGLGEAYMAGEWRAAPGTDLAEIFAPFAARLDAVLPRPLLALRGLVDRAIPREHRNTIDGARANVEAHYDLSNELFTRFLDPTLSYSSALFDPARPLAEQSLEEAQVRKIDAALDLAGVGRGTRLLEIGSGWGSLAIRAARRGAQVVTLTLSQEQAALARERVAAERLSDAVDVRLQDYREVTGQFDAVVSIEMIEAVGEDYWPTYFRSIDDVLAPGGRVVVQAILMAHRRYLATRHSFGWIQKYIFPGGLIPSLEAVEEVSARHTTMRVRQVHSFGPSYAQTLRRWRARFTEEWPRIAEHGFDETFRRMWEYYLAYCEAGFATGYLDVAQIQLTRGPAT